MIYLYVINKFFRCISMKRCIPTFLGLQASINFLGHKNNIFYKFYSFKYFSSVIFTFFYLENESHKVLVVEHFFATFLVLEMSGLSNV